MEQDFVLINSFEHPDMDSDKNQEWNWHDFSSVSLSVSPFSFSPYLPLFVSFSFSFFENRRGLKFCQRIWCDLLHCIVKFFCVSAIFSRSIGLKKEKERERERETVNKSVWAFVSKWENVCSLSVEIEKERMSKKFFLDCFRLFRNESYILNSDKLRWS